MILCKKEPCRLFSLSTVVYGAGSAAAVALGCAGPALPGHGCRRWWHQAASWAAVDTLRGGQGSRQTLEDAASRVWHARPQAIKARWLQWFNSSLPALTAGGRAIHPTFGAALQHEIRLWSLPPPLLPMPGASERVPHASSESLTFFVRFDLQTPNRVAHIVWKLLRWRNR